MAPKRIKRVDKLYHGIIFKYLDYICDLLEISSPERRFLKAVFQFWGPNGNPYPGKRAIATAMGISQNKKKDHKKDSHMFLNTLFCQHRFFLFNDHTKLETFCIGCR